MRSRTAVRDLAGRARTRFINVESAAGSAELEPALLDGRILILDPRLGSARIGVAVEHPWASELPSENRMAITTDDAEQLRIVDRPGATSQGHQASTDQVVAAIEAFSPDVTVFRPGPASLPLAVIAERLLRDGVPLVMAVEDTWFDDLAQTWPDRSRYWSRLLVGFARRSSAVFASSDALAATLASRWGIGVAAWIPGAHAVANIAPLRSSTTELRLAAAPDIRPGYGGNSLLLAALAVHQDPTSTLSIRTQARGDGHTIGPALGGLDGVEITPPGSTPPNLTDHYADADAVLYCHDFHGAASQHEAVPDTIPGLLASGRPIIAIGPAGAAAIELLRETGAALVVDTPEPGRIAWCINELRDPERRSALGQAATAALHHLRQRQPTRLLSTATSITRQNTSSDRVDRLRNAHAGQRCIIVGNGPSLRDTELDLLDGEVVFASNAIHLLFDDVAWRPMWYSAVDPLYLHERHEDIAQLLADNPMITGVFPTASPMHDGSGRIVRPDTLFADHPNALFVEPLGEMSSTSPHGAFSIDLTAGMVQPATVTIALMQMAAHLGFSELILIGCDTTYTIPDSVATSGPDVPDGSGEKLIITSTLDDDANHFAPDYFGAGRSWHHPRVDNMIRHYELSDEVLRLLGVTVVNATVGGALEVFPRTSLSDALARTSR